MTLRSQRQGLRAWSACHRMTVRTWLPLRHYLAKSLLRRGVFWAGTGVAQQRSTSEWSRIGTRLPAPNHFGRANSRPNRRLPSGFDSRLTSRSCERHKWYHTRSLLRRGTKIHETRDRICRGLGADVLAALGKAAARTPGRPEHWTVEGPYAVHGRVG